MTRDILSIALLVGVLVVAPLGATSPYFLITPGGTYDIGSRLRVPDEQRRPMGRMAFTAVYEQEANWGEVARAQLFGQEFQIQLYRRLFFNSNIRTFAGLIPFFVKLYGHLRGG